MDNIRVVVAEDDFFTRRGVCRILEEAPGIEVIGQAENGEDAIAAVQAKQPQILLLDIYMPPGIDGIQVIKQLRAVESQVLIIALTDQIRMIKLVEKAGGNGYIPKEKHQMLVPTVQCVAATGSNIFIKPEHSNAYSRIQEHVRKADLMEHELEVWGLIAYKNEEFARRLHKAEGSIRNLVTELYNKLNIPKSDKVSQRVQAIEMARIFGVLKTPSDPGITWY